MLKSDFLKKLLVVVNILSIVSFILVMISKTKFTYALFWITVPLIFVLILLFVREVDKGRMNFDIDKSKEIIRPYNDITTLTVIFYGITYLIVEFIDSIYKTVKENTYIIIIFFVLTILVEIFIFLTIKDAKNDTKKVLSKTAKPDTKNISLEKE